MQLGWDGWALGTGTGQGAGCTREPAVSACGVRGSGEEPAGSGRGEAGCVVDASAPASWVELVPGLVSPSRSPRDWAHQVPRFGEGGPPGPPHSWGTRVWRGEGGSALHRKWSVRLLEVPRTGPAFRAVLSGVSPGPRSESTERKPRARRRVPLWKGIRRGTWDLGNESPLLSERSSH